MAIGGSGANGTSLNGPAETLRATDEMDWRVTAVRSMGYIRPSVAFWSEAANEASPGSAEPNGEVVLVTP